MTARYLKNRWFDDQNAHYALIKIMKVLKRGGTLKNNYSPFKTLKNNYADFRGLDFSKYKIKKLKIKGADLSYATFCGSRIDKSTFENIIFNNVDFSNITDTQNLFKKVNFLKCKFDRSMLGYGGSRYVESKFEDSSFKRTGYVRAEFVNTQFKDNKLNGVDFYASSFENCSFIGKLADVWFRGEYPLLSDTKTFGKAKKNQMKNVSFEKAILEGVNFSNNCDLSTIKKPITGNYKIFSRWLERLKRLKNKIIEFPEEQRREVEIFAKSYLIHAKTQDWFLLNIEEEQKDFGKNIVNKIITILNEE
jgi:uncharacterized protein YjbI with pentapeptide repeats